MTTNNSATLIGIPLGRKVGAAEPPQPVRLAPQIAWRADDIPSLIERVER